MEGLHRRLRHCLRRLRSLHYLRLRISRQTTITKVRRKEFDMKEISSEENHALFKRVTMDQSGYLCLVCV